MKLELKYALIIGIGGFVWLLLEYATGLHGKHVNLHPFITSLSFLIPVIGLIVAMREKRDRELGGSMTYMEGVKTGTIISLITGPVAMLGQYLYHVINPSYFEFMIALADKRAVDAGLDLTIALEQAQAYFNLKSYVVQAGLGAIVGGFVISLIVAAFVKRGL